MNPVIVFENVHYTYPGDELESLCIDDSLEEAVTRYVRKGEPTRTGIMRELRAAYESSSD